MWTSNRINVLQPNSGTQGGRVVTEDICAVCYATCDPVTPDETKRSLDLEGKTPLTICRCCLGSGVEPPYSSGRTNGRQATEQSKATKKRQHDGAVEVG